MKRTAYIYLTFASHLAAHMLPLASSLLILFTVVGQVQAQDSGQQVVYHVVSVEEHEAYVRATSPKKKEQKAPLRANTRNLFFNVHALGSQATLDMQGFQPETTRGGGAKLGYGFSKALTLYLGLDIALSESINAPGSNLGLGYFDIGAQFNLTSGHSAFVPYLDVAATGRSAMLQTSQGDVTLMGVGGSFGGGVKIYLSPVVALDVNARLTNGSFSKVEMDGITTDISEVFGMANLGSTALGVSVGFSFNPKR